MTKKKLPKRVIKAFNKGRRKYWRDALLSLPDLERLRERVDQSFAGASFCDGCGFCCSVEIQMTELEYRRIARLVKEDPSLCRPQGLVCPFMEIDLEVFQQNLLDYGHTALRPGASRCRIYAERPLKCRMYPPPLYDRCRQYGMYRVPELNHVLKQKESEQFPELLIQKYYLTLRHEVNPPPKDALVEGSKFQLVPGWLIDRQRGVVERKDGPHWHGEFDMIPSAFPVAASCAYDAQGLEVVETLTKPTSYNKLLRKFGDTFEASDLGAFVAQLEVANIIVPIDWARRARRGRRGYWAWKSKT